MRKVINSEKIPIKMWLDDCDERAVEQAENLANLPFAFKHIALMPDCHTGYGMPIGGVIACKGAVVPNAVGVDIGCGMVAVKTDYCSDHISQEQVKKIMELIHIKVPVGFNHQKQAKEWDGFDRAPDLPIIQQELESAKKQLGTLGGGNHFIELQKGSDGFIWAMIHSGSRNFGLKIANEYNRKAQELCAQWYSNIPEVKGQDGLAFLPVNSKEGEEYIQAMNFALEFAFENRRLMMQEVKESLCEVLSCQFTDTINIHHNYARLEHHYGSNVWVHRKGATSAYAEELGLIPGSQGTASYVVIGKGNEESFKSCSHGAGRCMSRTKAQAELNLQTEQDKLNSQGIIHSIRSVKDLDEASGAYKDITTVMRNQEDLVEIITELRPIGVIKG